MSKSLVSVKPGNRFRFVMKAILAVSSVAGRLRFDCLGPVDHSHAGLCGHPAAVPREWKRLRTLPGDPTRLPEDDVYTA